MSKRWKNFLKDTGMLYSGAAGLLFIVGIHAHVYGGAIIFGLIGFGLYLTCSRGGAE